jgi:hypothetical protein
MGSVTFTAQECGSMPPEEDARAILRLALRHEHSLAASLDPAFAQEDWGFLAQQCVENLLKGLIVLADQQPPLSHDLVRPTAVAIGRGCSAIHRPTPQACRQRC